jgi:hypothetical protein
MRIGRPLLKLPIRFCGETLAREVRSLPPQAWMSHPQKFDGNIAVPLVSPGGEMVHRTFGPMGPTEWLRRCPYVLQIMQALDSTWGRSRFMGLEAGADVPPHVDIHYYWRTHLRIHIPVITSPAVAFTCNDETIHMASGDCWILDSFYRHSVANRGNETRVHLVLDTVGSAQLWDLIEAANAGDTAAALVAPGETIVKSLDFEQINAPLVMSPWEMKEHVAYIASWTDPQPVLDAVMKVLDRFIMSWSGTWARYGASEAGLAFYLEHLAEVRARLTEFGGADVPLRNGKMLLKSVDRFILDNAIAPAVLHNMRKGHGEAPRFQMTA